MSLTRRTFPSFDGPNRVSPYFYIPPKRRWWPTLAAFAAGGVGVLVLLGPSQPPDNVGAEQKPIAHQVPPGSSVAASKLRKPTITRTHPGAADTASSALASAPMPEQPMVVPNNRTAAAPPATPSVQAAPAEPPPTRAESLPQANDAPPAATQTETSPAISAKPSAREAAAKPAAEPPQAKKQRRHEPATATVARTDERRDRDGAPPTMPSAIASAPALAGVREPTATVPTAQAAATLPAASAIESAGAEPSPTFAQSAMAGGQDGNGTTPAAVQTETAQPTPATSSTRQSAGRAPSAPDRRFAKKPRQHEPATAALARDYREHENWGWGDNRDWGWDFRGERDFANRNFGSRDQRAQRDYQERESGDRALRNRPSRDYNLREREFRGRNFREYEDGQIRSARSPGYRRYSDFSGERFGDQGGRWGSWGNGPSFGARGGWFGED